MEERTDIWQVGDGDERLVFILEEVEGRYFKGMPRLGNRYSFYVQQSPAISPDEAKAVAKQIVSLLNENKVGL